MALSLKDLKRSHGGRGFRLLVHGQPKTGKTTLAASAPNPMFICTEDGLGRTEELANVPAFQVETWEEALAAIDVFIAAAESNEEYFGTLVIDSIDHLEALLWRHVCAKWSVDNIEQVDKGFGRGYAYAADTFRTEYNSRLRYIQTTLKRGVIEICHSAAIKENPPDNLQGFTRWTPKLNKLLVALLSEEADSIMYLAQPIITTETAAAFGNKTTKAAAVGERQLHLQPGGGYLAGSRFRAPAWVEAKWEKLEPYLPFVPERREPQAA